MRVVVQRVLSASVTVDGSIVGSLAEPGLLVLVGVTQGDRPEDASWLARKLWGLRILRDERAAADVDAPLLVVSQFTLYGDARKGRRPTWQAAAPGPVSEPLHEALCAELERLGARVGRGASAPTCRSAWSTTARSRWCSTVRRSEPGGPSAR